MDDPRAEIRVLRERLARSSSRRRRSSRTAQPVAMPRGRAAGPRGETNARPMAPDSCARARSLVLGRIWRADGVDTAARVGASWPRSVLDGRT